MARGRIWLVGGTRESADLAIALAQAHLPCTISVTTETAKALYPKHPQLRVVVAKFGAEALRQFLATEEISIILDVSHPYAVEISQRAIAAAAQTSLPYLRFERPRLDFLENQAVVELESWDALLTGNYLQGQRVLLTIGYRLLSQFQPWQEHSTLFARILPSKVALEAALAEGFLPERLFAMRPPIPLAIERALWQHWQISLVVTKASGQAGGEAIKRQLAAELGIKLIAISRPPCAYPQQTSDLAAALAFCHQLFSP